VKRIDDEAGLAALRLASLAQGTASEPKGPPDRETLALAVRWTLQRLAEQAPGHALEVRVPPYGAVQAIEGPRHTRGTPPNVVETDPATWLALATGELAFSAALAAGRLQASGTRTDLSGVLPLV